MDYLNPTIIAALITTIAAFIAGRVTSKQTTDYYDDFAIKYFREYLKEKSVDYSEIKKIGNTIGMSDDDDIRQIAFLAGIETDKSGKKWKIARSRRRIILGFTL